MWAGDVDYCAIGSGLPAGPVPASGVPDLAGPSGSGSVVPVLLGAAEVFVVEKSPTGQGLSPWLKSMGSGFRGGDGGAGPFSWEPDP
jgi:hypothetical protein